MSETQPSLAVRRINKELHLFRTDPVPRCTAEPIGDNIYNWRGIMKGPPDTPYEGGTFLLDIIFPIDYPFNPPHVQFLTKMYHPKVDSIGLIDIDILTNYYWTPKYTIYDVLGEVYLLMFHKQVTGTQVEIDNFEKIAKWWTRKFAK